MAAPLIDIATARARVVEGLPAPVTEPVELTGALGRVLAEDLVAAHPLPPFDASAMDGFAARAGAAADLPVVGESRAGHPASRTLEPGEAMRISTGAQMPVGAEAVVPIERVEELDGGCRVRLPDRTAGAHIRRAGEDTTEGELVLRAGTPIGPAEVGVLAALGRPLVPCARQPRVAVLVTGDELLEPDAELGPGQIRDSNAYALAAQAVRAGAEVVHRAVVRDDQEATVAAIRTALAAADVLCVSGGVSVGPHDHVKPALAVLGVEERFWGVALKPGKPTWFGRREDRLVFGLPGNPVSAMITFHLFVRPALRRLAGADHEEVRSLAILDASVPREPHREQVLRCRLRAGDDGWHVEPTGAQGSHVLTSMLGAGALALVPAGEGELPVGSRLEVEILF